MKRMYSTPLEATGAKGPFYYVPPLLRCAFRLKRRRAGGGLWSERRPPEGGGEERRQTRPSPSVLFFLRWVRRPLRSGGFVASWAPLALPPSPATLRASKVGGWGSRWAAAEEEEGFFGGRRKLLFFSPLAFSSLGVGG